MTEKRAITEKDNVQKEWYEEAKKQTPATIGDFINKLVNNYAHDYGTICHAVTAAAIAAASAVDNSPVGGITGFQASCINMQFIQEWAGVKPPFRLLKFRDLLFPQKKNEFTTISEDTWNWLQEEAKKEIDAGGLVCSEVESHWRSIINGKVPFGLKVVDKDGKEIDKNSIAERYIDSSSSRAAQIIMKNNKSDCEGKQTIILGGNE